MLSKVLKQHKKVSIVKTNNNIILDSNENPYKIYNIEKFTDVIASNCMTRRPKCILCHPDNMFYTIVNKVFKILKVKKKVNTPKNIKYDVPGDWFKGPF
jgi:hypothetical protein